MAPSDDTHRGHRKLRAGFRIVGPVLLLGGIACIATALVDFFMVAGEFGRQPRLFWMFFLGAPLFSVGFLLTSAGYMGAIARYAAREQAPVAADTLNYLAAETEPGVRTIAAAVRGGLVDIGRPCPACAQANDADARLCGSCGGALLRTCASCRHENDADANFCDSCGRPLA